MVTKKKSPSRSSSTVAKPSSAPNATPPGDRLGRGRHDRVRRLDLDHLVRVVGIRDLLGGDELGRQEGGQADDGRDGSGQDRQRDRPPAMDAGRRTDGGRRGRWGGG